MNKSIILRYQELSISELSEADIRLVLQAQEATASAYSPYSNFCVGAALRLADGSVVKGSNQENAAYPSGMCAERTAMFAASAQHPNVPFDALAVIGRNANSATRSDNWAAASPCGACRQVMAEYEARWNHKMRIILYFSNNKILIFEGVENLLPFIFTWGK